MNLTCIWRRPKSVGFVEHVNVGGGGVKRGDVRGNVSTTASQPSAYPPPQLGSVSRATTQVTGNTEN